MGRNQCLHRVFSSVFYTDNEQVLKFKRNPGSECETILNDLLRFGDFSVCYHVLKNTRGRIKISQESSRKDDTRDRNFFIVCCRSAGRLKTSSSFKPSFHLSRWSSVNVNV